MAYRKDTDYQELIERSVREGDLASAARYEKQRNEKILGEGLDYDTTDYYSRYLTDDRVEVSRPEYEDKPAAQRPRYEGAVSSLDDGQTGTRLPAATETKRPVYDSRYDAKIDELLQNILDREAFQYTPQDDPLYQQYAATYLREGDRALADTMAAAASGAGGMNSYAMTAAQQANDYYRAKLGDALPQLYQMAWSMYRDEADAKRNDLATVQALEKEDYGRYLDSLSQYNADRNFAYGQYRDQVADYQWGTGFNYATRQDAYDRADRDYDRYDTLTGGDPLEPEPKLPGKTPDYVIKAADWMSSSGRNVQALAKWMKNAGYTADQAEEALAYLGCSLTSADYLMAQAGYA